MNDFFKNDYFKNFQAFPGFQSFKTPQVPQMDVNRMFTLQRKNMEAFSAATQAVNGSLQAIARRSAEFVRDNVEEALSTSREIMTGNTAPEKAAEKQSEFAKQSFQNSLEQIREVTEMASKAQFEAFDILSARFSRSIDEVKDLSSKKAA